MSSESDKPSPVRVHIVVAGDDTGSSTDDVHYCGKCKLVFTSIKDYLEHKVSHDNCQVAFVTSDSGGQLIPTVEQQGNQAKLQCKSTGPGSGPGDITGPTGEQPKPARKRGRRETVDEDAIVQKTTYSCSVCGESYNRLAALKRHVVYDHELAAAKKSVDEKYGSEDSEEVVGNEEANDGEAPPDEEYSPAKRAKTLKSTNSPSPSEKLLVCSVCGSKFKTAGILRSHLLTHSDKRAFKCTEKDCNYAFKTKGALTRHLRRHTGERPYPCTLCGRSFAESGALTRHLKSRISCREKVDSDLPRYGKRWGFDTQLPVARSSAEASPSVGDSDAVTVEQQPAEGNTDVAEAAEEQSSQEAQEEEYVEENNEVTEMVTEEVGTEQSDRPLSGNTCQVCRLEFGNEDELRCHLRMHLADTTARCDVCHFVTDSYDKLQQHQLQHGHGTSELLGENVGVANKTRSGEQSADRLIRDAKLAVQQLIKLQDPSKSSSPSVEGMQVCPICQRTFRGQSYMSQHMRVHTGEKPFQCSQCMKTFVCRDALNKHMTVHNNERQFKCGDCGKLFKRISHVREHLKIHTFDRPFQCTVCTKSFKTSNAAKVHIRTHSDHMPYECTVCHRFFREKGSLQRHVRMHTGEKPYKCPHCGRAFAEHGTLGRHLKAKVPCTYYPPEGRDEGSPVTREQGYPTVLAEFSSVVADTQQYILPDTETTTGETAQETEFVVVQSSDIPVDSIQNIEIMSSGDGGELVVNGDGVLTEGSQYIVVGEPGEELRVLDSLTGHTIATVSADTVSVEERDQTEMIPSHVQGLTEASDQDNQTPRMIHTLAEALTPEEPAQSNPETPDNSNLLQAIRQATQKQSTVAQMIPTADQQVLEAATEEPEDEASLLAGSAAGDSSVLRTIITSDQNSVLQTLRVAEHDGQVEMVPVDAEVQAIEITPEGELIQAMHVNDTSLETIIMLADPTSGQAENQL